MYHREYKIALFGDTGVGKTALLEKFADNRSCYNYIPTIGVDCRTKIIYVDGWFCKLKIWDITGGDKFINLINPYISDLDACVIMFDVTNLSSMKSIKKWLTLVQSKNSPTIPIIIVANKYDVKHTQPTEPYVDASIFNSKNFTTCSFIQSSIKTNYNVDQIFITLVQQLLAAQISFKTSSVQTFDLVKPIKKCKLLSYFCKFKN
jgi:small GTP-binding protein